MRTCLPRTRGRKIERGATDTSIIFMAIGLAVLLTVGMFVLGWIRSVKEARTAHPVQTEDNKPITSPYHEPGAFQVTF